MPIVIGQFELTDTSDEEDKMASLNWTSYPLEGDLEVVIPYCKPASLVYSCIKASCSQYRARVSGRYQRMIFCVDTTDCSCR